MKSFYLLLFLGLACQASMQSTNNASKPYVIAHRGLPYFAPEETLFSYQLAADIGADYLEADLQRTRDSVIICLHDNNLRRTTNIEDVFPDRADDPVSTFNLDELLQLDAGAWFNQKFPDKSHDKYNGLKILTLNQLLKIAESSDNQPGVYLETKHPDQFPGIEKQLHKQLDHRGWVGTFFDDGRPKLILQSFSSESLALLHRYFPSTPLCYLLWKGEGCLVNFDKDYVQKCLEQAKMFGVSIIGPSFSGERTHYFNLMQPWFVQMVNEKGFDLHPYTFDTPKDISTYAPLSSGQFTNRADLLLDYYHRAHPTVSELMETLNIE